METQPLFTVHASGTTDINCFPRAPCGDTFLKSSKKDLERAEHALLNFLRPVVLREPLPGDKVLVFTPGAPTVCGSRAVFSSTSLAVTMKGVNVCNSELDATAWPFNLVFPRQTMFLFACQWFFGLLFLIFQMGWGMYFLFDGQNSFPVLTYSNWFVEVITISFFIFGLIDYTASIILGIVAIVFIFVLVLSLAFKNRGSAYRLIEITRRLSIPWTLLQRWFLLSLPIGNAALFWTSNVLSALGLVVIVAFPVWVSVLTGEYAALAFAALFGLLRLIADVAAAIHAGSESADIPRSGAKRFWNQCCCDILCPALKKTYDLKH